MAITVGEVNPFFSSVAGVLFNKNQTTLIQCPGGMAGNYTIPSSVTNIGSAAFFGCDSLTNATIPNGVISIGRWTFARCYGLASVTIPNGVTSIGVGAFSGCDRLTSVKIPNSVTSIESEAFSECGSLTSITIPNSVTYIAERTFIYCDSLTTATIPNSVTGIGPFAFFGCIHLTGVYFMGNAFFVSSSVFEEANNATVYFKAGTTGWGTTFGGRPTALWDDCLYGLSPTAWTASGSGGTGTFSVTTTGACSWSAVANQSWLHTTNSGSGNGKVSFTVDANPAASTRSGTIRVGTQTFTVTQTGPGWVSNVAFGWLWDTGTGWYGGSAYGWMWFQPGGQWIWSTSLQGWLAVTDPNSRAVWSTQFRWLTPSESDPYRADTTAIGAIYLGQYNGTAITEGWVVSGRLGYVWAAGDGKWFYSNTYGWLGVTENGGIWCVNQNRFL